MATSSVIPFFPTGVDDTAGAELRDFFAVKLFDTAAMMIGRMSVDELNIVAEAVGLSDDGSGRYTYNMPLMTSYTAYELADSLIAARSIVPPAPGT